MAGGVDGNKGRPKVREQLGMTPEQEEEDRMMIACRLAAFRYTTGMNITEFYNNIGVPPNTGGNYERGFALPTIALARLLFRREGLSMDWLYEGKTHGMPAERMASITKRLPITIADFKDRIEMEKRSNEREGHGYYTNAQLHLLRETERSNASYNAMREAREARDKLKAEKAPAKKRK